MCVCRAGVGGSPQVLRVSLVYWNRIITNRHKRKATVLNLTRLPKLTEFEQNVPLEKKKRSSVLQAHLMKRNGLKPSWGGWHDGGLSLAP